VTIRGHRGPPQSFESRGSIPVPRVAVGGFTQIDACWTRRVKRRQRGAGAGRTSGRPSLVDSQHARPAVEDGPQRRLGEDLGRRSVHNASRAFSEETRSAGSTSPRSFRSWSTATTVNPWPPVEVGQQVEDLDGVAQVEEGRRLVEQQEARLLGPAARATMTRWALAAGQLGEADDRRRREHGPVRRASLPPATLEVRARLSSPKAAEETARVRSTPSRRPGTEKGDGGTPAGRTATVPRRDRAAGRSACRSRPREAARPRRTAGAPRRARRGGSTSPEPFRSRDRQHLALGDLQRTARATAEHVVRRRSSRASRSSSGAVTSSGAGHDPRPPPLAAAGDTRRRGAPQSAVTTADRLSLCRRGRGAGPPVSAPYEEDGAGGG